MYFFKAFCAKTKNLVKLLLVSADSLKGTVSQGFWPLFCLSSIIHMIIRHFKNITYFSRWTIHFQSHFRCEWFTTIVTLAVNGSLQKWFLNFLSSFYGYNELFPRVKQQMLESLPLWMVHHKSDFVSEWFNTEVTLAGKGSPPKSLTQWLVHRRSQFPGEPFTTEVNIFSLNEHSLAKTYIWKNYILSVS